jgi:dihydrofolate reductase
MTVSIGMAMSLDGFVDDTNGDVTALYPDLTQGSMRDNKIIQESIESTGAVVMGRGAYDMADGNFTEYEYQVPIFVLTHHPPNETPVEESEGGLTIEFVTDGLQQAIEKAETAAGEQDVTVVGGTDVTQQCIRAGLFDELHVALVPLLLCEELRCSSISAVN